MKTKTFFILTAFIFVFLALNPVQGHSSTVEELNQYFTKLYSGTQGIPIPPDTLDTYYKELLAKAQPDECYAGIGNPNHPPKPPCKSKQYVASIPKTNEAYIWGLTNTGDHLWFGTIANTHCLVMGAVMDGFLGLTIPMENTSWVCEFGESPFSPPLQPPYGDWRMPHVYRYNLATGALADNSPFLEPLIFDTVGLRSAGNLNNVVILGGPGMTGGINLFAYRVDTGAYLGSAKLLQYNDIRKWIIHDGVLYTGVQNTAGGGSVLRWTGNLANPFLFEVVGNLDSSAAELEIHEGRLFANTWPAFPGGGSIAGLYMSPVIPFGGLTNADAANWTNIWRANDYEPDPLTAATYGGGALASYDGYLYWSTMHVPMISAVAAITSLDLDANGNGQLDVSEILNATLGTYRATSIFRGRDFGVQAQTMEVVYGLQYMPVYNPALKEYTIALDPAHENNMPNPVPAWGLSGFGNFFNAYTWNMVVFNDTLFIGTFDWSYLLVQGLMDLLLEPFAAEGALSDGDSLQSMVVFPPYRFGADLFRIESNLTPAMPEDVSGLGNPMNYGIRTSVPAPGGAVYFGTANPMNLLPEGGWELIKMEPFSTGTVVPPNPPRIMPPKF